MLCVKVDLKLAEKTKNLLAKKGLIDKNYFMQREGNYFFIPVLKKVPKYEIIEKDMKLRDKTNDFSTEVKKILSSQELLHLNTAYDSVGSIAILEIDDELINKEKQIADVLLKSNNSIKTVVKKLGAHEGEYRLQNYKFLSGVNNFETISKENGINLKLDIRKTYYSLRSSGERLRVNEQIKKGEKILVMFSGVGIYGFVFSKHSPASKIIEIEINPDAHKYALESLKLNKQIKNVDLICGDVRKVLKDTKDKFDRIVMPLPKTANEFLDIASKVSKKGSILHFYFFDILDVTNNTSKLVNLFNKYFSKFKILRVVKAGQQSPRIYRLCADVLIE